MRTPNRGIALIVIFTWLLSSQPGLAEDVRDTRITPTQGTIPGEFYHGSVIHGKLLIKVLFFGAIGQQGIHYIIEGTDILSALLYAGGYSEDSKIESISIRRKNQKDLIKVDLLEVIEDGVEPPKLQDDDVVTIPFNWRKDVGTITLITGFVTAISTFATTLLVLLRYKQ